MTEGGLKDEISAAIERARLRQAKRRAAVAYGKAWQEYARRLAASDYWYR